MKSLLMLFLVAFALLFGGCVSREIGESGYQEITASETEVLVNYARAIIRNEKTHLRGNQLSIINKTEPEIRISYRGDLYGRAIVSWHLERKVFRVVFTGLLTSLDPQELYFRYSVIRESLPQIYSGDTNPQDIEMSEQERRELYQL